MNHLYKKVYLAMSADIIHHGHLNVIERARQLGNVIIGLHTDEVITEYWRTPFLTYSERKKIIENIKGVVEVIPQDSLDQVPNLVKLKPDFVVHGDDWQEGVQKSLRLKVIEVLKQWNGELIEIPYTSGISISKIEKAFGEIGITPEARMKRLRRAISNKGIVRILEAHNGLTGLIVEKTKVAIEGKVREFDGLWVSSLCDSTAKGKPDIELVDVTSRLNTINDILEVTTKPIILDGDTGGLVEHFVYTVKSVERLGVSAIIIEDKIGLKKNSLFGTDVTQMQDTLENFSTKIRAGREARVTNEFMIIARIESLIMGVGIEDALARARAYSIAGADGIMIHSKDKSGMDIKTFCLEFRKWNQAIPIILVPSTYNHITEDEFETWGANVVIYANHLIRSAYPAMLKTAESILTYRRSTEADSFCMPIKDILELIPGTK